MRVMRGKEETPPRRRESLPARWKAKVFRIRVNAPLSAICAGQIRWERSKKRNTLFGVSQDLFRLFRKIIVRGTIIGLDAAAFHAATDDAELAAYTIFIRIAAIQIPNLERG